MRRIGFFAQLRHGRPDGPDLAAEAERAELAPERRQAVATYLRECPVVAATSERAGDALDAAKTDVSGINIHTDGEFVWPEDLAYYAETYGVGVPDEIVERAERGGVPVLDDEQMGAVMTWMLSQMTA
ncbi:hypothetical protein [Lapillicoccus sp.]|uniref:hypothetical protein n=1 Tax=Lapillicoccus sp. TaxID=1909287 RepID=UPI0032652695